MKIISRDEYFMNIALKEAEKAAEIGEVPVGAVVVSVGAEGSGVVGVSVVPAVGLSASPPLAAPPFTSTMMETSSPARPE